MAASGYRRRSASGVERLGEELILDWSKTLSERLQEDTGFTAIPAIFAYALAVMEQIHRPSANGS